MLGSLIQAQGIAAEHWGGMAAAPVHLPCLCQWLKEALPPVLPRASTKPATSDFLQWEGISGLTQAWGCSMWVTSQSVPIAHLGAGFAAWEC